jgi:hypothetical protein
MLFAHGRPWTVILLPLLPEYVGLQIRTTTSGLFVEVGSH